jgi:hypothetical protein
MADEATNFVLYSKLRLSQAYMKKATQAMSRGTKFIVFGKNFA